MTRRLCVIPGDGIGPEVIAAAVEVLKAVVPDLETRFAQAGWQTFLDTGNSIPSETIEAIKDCRAGLFGAVSSPSRKVEGYSSSILQIRQQLKLSANVRPVDGLLTERPDIDLIIVRENTEDLYIRKERREGDLAIAERWISEPACKMIGLSALEIARQFNKNKITIVHKANVLPITDGLFRDTVRQEIEKNCPQVQIEERLVDVAALQLVSMPEQFEIIVTSNMFGDILSDLASHWSGGLGKAPSLNLGEGIAVAEPVHGSAPDIAGKGIADPTAAMLSAALLCRLHWKDAEAADRIEAALVTASSIQRKDFTTAGFTDDVLAAIDDSA